MHGIGQCFKVAYEKSTEGKLLWPHYICQVLSIIPHETEVLAKANEALLKFACEFEVFYYQC